MGSKEKIAIYGTGRFSLKKGETYHVSKELANTLVKNGSATMELPKQKVKKDE